MDCTGVLFRSSHSEFILLHVLSHRNGLESSCPVGLNKVFSDILQLFRRPRIRNLKENAKRKKFVEYGAFFS